MAATKFAFGRRNYRLMLLGLALLAAGFITMTLDTADYGEGFLGITLGPLLLVAGFIVEFFAIMAKSDNVPVAETTAPSATATLENSQPVAPVAAPRPTYKRS
ncbi:DUF3098 domain-containing protein [Hymenobacter sp. BT730]|uniref:DUF3098 domain-containing protein n=1 Tax=Hymenobacter sp. BT730 TaxID=3063332 RepID=UPI0026DF7B02|nr:DUF3098 domain-containing protein [Hymenobacter sp. BT730]